MATPEELPCIPSRVPVSGGRSEDPYREAVRTVGALLTSGGCNSYFFGATRGRPLLERVRLSLFSMVPLLGVLTSYQLKWIVGDVIAGCTIASIAVPQDLAYAKLANLPPVHGLYSSFSPPLIYAFFGSSRHIAVGPVSVVSSIVGTLASQKINPKKDDPEGKIDPKTKKIKRISNEDYVDLVLTATFFSGIIQLGLGMFRLGFIVDYLSHPSILGFMTGAAITISLGQLWGITGYINWTPKTDLISIINILKQYHHQFNWRALVIGVSFLIYLQLLKYTAKYFNKNRIIFFLNAFGPLTCVVVSTFCVYVTRTDKHGLKTVGHIRKGVNPSSLKSIRFDDYFDSQGNKIGNFAKESFKIAIVAGLIALTEAIAIGRTFAAKGKYRTEGNQEMVAFGAANLVSSVTSGYVVTGSFSRTAINFFAGAKSVLSNVVMAVLVLFTLLFITPLFFYLPIAVLSAIIISALTNLIDIEAIIEIWKTDFIDFLTFLGCFFGVLFISAEVGLLISTLISVFRLLIQITRPKTSILGKVPETSFFRNVVQYPNAESFKNILILRIDSTICFANSTYLREIIENLVEKNKTEYSENYGTENLECDQSGRSIELFVILDLSPVGDIDSSGIKSLEDLYHNLENDNIQLALSNPSKPVFWKLKKSKILKNLVDDWLFLSVEDGVKFFKILLEKNKKKNIIDCV